MRGIGIDIFRSDLGDCTNRGVSAPSRAKGKIFIVFDEQIEHGNWDLEECSQDPERFVCLRVVRRWEGTPNEYLHLEPMYENHPQKCGPMFGGNYGFSSDSRFRAVSSYPLPIHDRFET